MSQRGRSLPRALTLPSGLRVALRARSAGPAVARTPEEGAPLFSEALAVFDRDVALTASKGADVDVRDLPLADFHVLRAVLTKAGLFDEEAVAIECNNCGEHLDVRPCERLEIGPYEDGELDDPELDATAELGAPLETAPIPIGRVREARTVTLLPRTVREAAPLWAALAAEPFEIDEEVVTAMGIAAIGRVRDPARIARALSECDDAAFASVADAFLAAHYAPRLASDVFCPRCKARNTVDAPYERELEPGFARAPDADGAVEERRALPPLDEFVELAHAIAEPLIAEIPGEKAELVVEGGTPAVDDGGAPLLGSYVPPPPQDAPVPTRPPTITVYYRTFEALERDEGPFDWEGELRETIEHELEHHVYFLRGEDPLDEEERAEIDREVVRVVGRGESTRRSLAALGLGIVDFFRRAWPLVLIAAIVLAITIAEGRCSD